MSIAEKYAVALRQVNVALPVELIQELLELVERIHQAGNLRTTHSGQEYSVLDFIGNVLGKENERMAWKRLRESHLDVVTFLVQRQFLMKDGRLNRKSPATNTFGLILVAYYLPGEFGDRLRSASAHLIVETLKSYKQGLDTLLGLKTELDSPTPAFPYSDIDIWRFTKYATLAYTRNVIRKDYELGVDYIEIEKRIYMTLDATAIALNGSRSVSGCDIPDEIKQHSYPWDKARQREKVKINRRRVQNAEPTIPGFVLV